MEKRINQSDDEISVEDYSIEDLRKSLENKGKCVSPIVASVLLQKKDYPQKLDDFRKILENKSNSTRLRRSAAEALGTIKSDEAFEICLKNIDEDVELIARGLVESLMQIDDSLTAANIEQRVKKDLKSISLKQIATMYEYRKKLLKASIRFPLKAKFKKVDPKKVRPIIFSPVAPELANKNVQKISGSMSGLELTNRNATRIVCGTRELMILYSKELSTADDIGIYAKKKCFIGVVAENFKYASKSDWDIKYFAVSQPGNKTDRIQLILTSTSGEIALAGEGKISEGKAKIVLKTVYQAGAIPKEIYIEYKNGDIIFKRARSEMAPINTIVPKLLTDKK